MSGDAYEQTLVIDKDFFYRFGEFFDLEKGQQKKKEKKESVGSKESLSTKSSKESSNYDNKENKEEQNDHIKSKSSTGSKHKGSDDQSYSVQHTESSQKSA